MHKNSTLNNIVLSFKDIFKKYNNEDIIQLSDINFSIFRNEFVCLVGPSGCGKSTILKMAAGIETPSGGEVKCDCTTAMVFQNGALLPWRTVYENISIVLESVGFLHEKVNEEVRRYLVLMKLESFADSYPANLSGGQRQRVGIARALVMKPELLLLDEPFSALDEKTSAELYNDLLKIREVMKITILMTTHRIDEVVSLADRVIVVSEGKIKKDMSISIGFPRRNHELEFIQTVNEIRSILFRS